MNVIYRMLLLILLLPGCALKKDQIFIFKDLIVCKSPPLPQETREIIKAKIYSLNPRADMTWIYLCESTDMTISWRLNPESSFPTTSKLLEDCKLFDGAMKKVNGWPSNSSLLSSFVYAGLSVPIFQWITTNDSKLEFDYTSSIPVKASTVKVHLIISSSDGKHNKVSPESVESALRELISSDAWERLYDQKNKAWSANLWENAERVRSRFLTDASRPQGNFALMIKKAE